MTFERMRAARLLLALAVLAVASFNRLAYAQTETGNIRGSVSDPTGAVVVNATVVSLT